jgi:hypothetical protein
MSDRGELAGRGGKGRDLGPVPGFAGRGGRGRDLGPVPGPRGAPLGTASRPADATSQLALPDALLGAPPPWLTGRHLRPPAENLGSSEDDVISLPGTPRTPDTPSRAAIESLAALQLQPAPGSAARFSDERAAQAAVHEALLANEAMKQYLAAEERQRRRRAEMQAIGGQMERLTPEIGRLLAANDLDRLHLPDGGALVLLNRPAPRPRLTNERLQQALVRGLVHGLHVPRERADEFLRTCMESARAAAPPARTAASDGGAAIRLSRRGKRKPAPPAPPALGAGPSPCSPAPAASDEHVPLAAPPAKRQAVDLGGQMTWPQLAGQPSPLGPDAPTATAAAAAGADPEDGAPPTWVKQSSDGGDAWERKAAELDRRIALAPPSLDRAPSRCVSASPRTPQTPQTPRTPRGEPPRFRWKDLVALKAAGPDPRPPGAAGAASPARPDAAHLAQLRPSRLQARLEGGAGPLPLLGPMAAAPLAAPPVAAAVHPVGHGARPWDAGWCGPTVDVFAAALVPIVPTGSDEARRPPALRFDEPAQPPVALESARSPQPETAKSRSPDASPSPSPFVPTASEAASELGSAALQHLRRLNR